ncbi:hypothetical protein DMB37_39710 [Nocardia sp. CS682]|nr:hypothetical protein DMB37_39710 [Nocardia sp. CS682]
MVAGLTVASLVGVVQAGSATAANDIAVDCAKNVHVIKFEDYKDCVAKGDVKKWEKEHLADSGDD